MPEQEDARRAADAAFLLSTPTFTTTNKKDDSASHATSELYRNNLLRMEASELLSESVLRLSPGESSSELEVSWAGRVRDYVAVVQDVLLNVKGATLNKETALMPSSKDRYWIKLQSDKALKTVDSAEWEFNFFGGKSLKVEPVGCFGGGGVGFTTLAANANVLPTVDLAVLLLCYNEQNKGTIGGKDYLNHRYFDKQNILAVYIAKYLSQKKQRKLVGSVHLVRQDGNERKVALLLTPPRPESPTMKNNEAQLSKKRLKKSDDVVKDEPKNTKIKKQGKVRFRVRLLFGVHSPSSNHDTHWMPSARLFPNRCNIHIHYDQALAEAATPTPYYNNALAEDIHYVSSTQIISSTFTKVKNPALHQALTLIKIWCLQRGFLRGHDTFDTTSLALLLSYLCRTKLVGARMACSIQIFTVFVKFLSEVDWLGRRDSSVSKNQSADESAVGRDTIRHSKSEGYRDIHHHYNHAGGHDESRTALVLPEEGKTEEQTIAQCTQNRLYSADVNENHRNNESMPTTLLKCYKAMNEGPVFLDPTMTVNYFGKISPSFMKEVVIEARKALGYVHVHSTDGNSESGGNSFQHLFLNHCRFWRRYDAYVRLDLDAISIPISEQIRQESLWNKDNADFGKVESILRGLVHVLGTALGDRVTAIRVLTTGNGEIDDGSGTSVAISGLPDDVVGTSMLVDSDENLIVPIRGTLTSTSDSFAGYELQSHAAKSPVADDKTIVIGIRIDPDTCHRIVDRGPPADDALATKAFVGLWGKKKAQLRRFKDGAIVHAVLWNEKDLKEIGNGNQYVQFEGDEKVGGIVERIVRHIVGLHFYSRHDDCKNRSIDTKFAFREMMSLIEGVATPNNAKDKFLVDSSTLYKDIMSSFNALASFLRDNTVTLPGTKEGSSKLGLPLSIDAVEPLAPCLRYSEVFPPVPHPLLGGKSMSGSKKVSGIVVGNPILIQIRFEGSSKWPADIHAMEAAKCAMLIQVADGIDKMKAENRGECVGFDGPMNVTLSHMDVGFRGYSWRIVVRADQEVKMLRALRKPTPEAMALCQVLTKQHVIGAMHHSAIHAVHTKHPSAGMTVRLAKRWIAAHMLSDLIPHEAIELLVASIFTNPAPLDVPATVMTGFMRFLNLLAFHDWVRQPLIVDPHGHIDGDDRAAILSQFEHARGPTFQHGAAMYIISPSDRNKNQDNDCTWAPSFTHIQPERVIVTRASALALRSYHHLLHNVIKADMSLSDGNAWAAVFQESASSLMSYSVLLRVDPELVVDQGSSSTGLDTMLGNDTDNDTAIVSPFTRSMKKRNTGPKRLCRKIYKNLSTFTNAKDGILHCWRPVESLVAKLRAEFGRFALFMYNEFAPDVIAVLWRPTTFESQPFSAVNSEYKRPVDDGWKSDSLVVSNASDILREIRYFVRDVVVDVKVLDDRSIGQSVNLLNQGGKRKLSDNESDNTSSGTERD